MDNAFLDGDIGHRNGCVFVDCHQSQTMEVADVDGDRFLVEICWEVELHY